MIKDKFSVVHYNIQCISDKVDIIESEFSIFHIICLTGTWLDERTSNNILSLNECNLCRRDGVGDNHGGLCVYVKQNSLSCRRQDIEFLNIKCLGIECSTRNNFFKYINSKFYPKCSFIH